MFSRACAGFTFPDIRRFAWHSRCTRNLQARGRALDLLPSDPVTLARHVRTKRRQHFGGALERVANVVVIVDAAAPPRALAVLATSGRCRPAPASRRGRHGSMPALRWACAWRAVAAVQIAPASGGCAAVVVLPQGVIGTDNTSTASGTAGNARPSSSSTAASHRYGVLCSGSAVCGVWLHSCIVTATRHDRWATKRNRCSAMSGKQPVRGCKRLGFGNDRCQGHGELPTDRYHYWASGCRCNRRRMPRTCRRSSVPSAQHVGTRTHEPLRAHTGGGVRPATSCRLIHVPRMHNSACCCRLLVLLR